WTKFAAKYGRIVRQLVTRHDLHNLHQVVLVFGIFLSPNDERALHALMVRSAIQGLAVSHAVEFEALEGFDDGRGIESPGSLACIAIEECLHIASLRRLRGRRSKFLSK